jgi:hypothetical protein
MPHQGVEQAIARRCFKAHHIMESTSCGQENYPCRPAKVNYNTGLPCITEEDVVRQSSQRNALAACRDVAIAKVANRGDAGALCNHSRHADCQRRWESALGVVPKLVTRTTNALDVLQTHARPVCNASSGCCERLTEQAV